QDAHDRRSTEAFAAVGDLHGTRRGDGNSGWTSSRIAIRGLLGFSMTSQQTIDLFKQYVIGNYTRYPVCLVRGEGSHVWDAEGNRYLDFFPGWGCDLIGHCPPRVVAAVREQVGKLIHVPNTWYTEEQGKLAQALSERTGWGGQCFFCNSGTEAVEAAIKLA